MRRCALYGRRSDRRAQSKELLGGTGLSLLQVTSVSKSFAGTTVLRDVSFHVEEGEIVCLLGPSGCGKTTLLRIIAGLELADSGHVLFEDRLLDDVPVHLRGFGLMFQDYALFPHKDVAANVAFGLRMQALSQDHVQDRVAGMLALVGLTGYDGRRVYDLSGGERQRVALARSLAPGPRLLMLDEPIGSLDRTLREDLMNELRTILKRVGVTAIYVTHDQEDAFAVADRVAIMRQGCIVQEGRPQSVYLRPASAWVARFLGLSNLIPGRVVASEPLRVDTLLGELSLEHIPDRPTLGQEVTVLIRPEAAQMALPSAPRLAGTEAKGPQTGSTETVVGGDLLIEATVRGCSFRGSHYLLTVLPAVGPELVFEMTSGGSGLPATGESITLSLRRDAIGLLPEAPDETSPQGPGPARQ